MILEALKLISLYASGLCIGAAIGIQIGRNLRK